MAGIASPQRPGSSFRGYLAGNTFRKKILPWLFILPIALLHLLVVIGPALSGVYYSLTEWSGFGKANYIGFENFRKLLFDDPNYVNAFLHNLLWMSFFLTIPITVALLASYLLSQIKRGAMFIRTAIFIPYVLPSVVGASLWLMLMNPTIGIGPSLGIKFLDHPWLGDQKTALLSIAFADNWHWWGFLTILFLTAMQSISPDLYDAAKIDGANRFQEFRFITIPGIRPTIIFLLMMTAVWSFLVFDYGWLMTQGGPAGSTELLAIYIYKKAFLHFEVGYATAASLTITLIAALIIGTVGLLRKRGWEI